MIFYGARDLLEITGSLSSCKRRPDWRWFREHVWVVVMGSAAAGLWCGDLLLVLGALR